jgi:hypothetical protein
MAGEAHFIILAGILLLQYGALQSWKGEDCPFWLYHDFFLRLLAHNFQNSTPDYPVMPVNQYEERGQE